MKTTLLTATAALALLAAPALAQDKLKIGMTFQEMNNPYFVSMQEALNEAAADLGAGAWTRFRRVSLPLTIEGISSGCTLVFLISTGFYATPVLLGGPSTTVFAETIAGFFHVAGDEWPTGAAFATIMFVAAVCLTSVFRKLMESLQKGGRS